MARTLVENGWEIIRAKNIVMGKLRFFKGFF